MEAREAKVDLSSSVTQRKKTSIMLAVGLALALALSTCPKKTFSEMNAVNAALPLTNKRGGEINK